MTRHLLTITAALLLAACGPEAPDQAGDAPADSTADSASNPGTYSPPPRDCTDELVASIELRIVDGENQEPVRGAVAWASDGARVDTLTTGDGFAAAMWERAGTYEVHIEHPSYATWDSSVVVPQGDCHVVTQSVRVMLQPVR